VRTGVLCVLVLAAVAIVGCWAQIPIPNRYDGLVQGQPNSPLLLDAFFDLLCPDCAAVWPTLQQVMAFYNAPNQASNIRLYLHAFPLPYHHNGFYAAQGMKVVESQAGLNNAWDYVNVMFENQASFWDDPTAGMTAEQVQAQMGAMVESNNIMAADQFVAGLNNDTYNMNTRIGWKYGCSRGVAGTPTFFINGIPVQADASWTFADWRSVLDPLLPDPSKMNTLVSGFTRHAAPPNCQPGQKLCNYSPNKYQCCPAGEQCIPNVGCRC